MRISLQKLAILLAIGSSAVNTDKVYSQNFQEVIRADPFWDESHGYRLIFLDSTDAYLATSAAALQLNFYDPWGNLYSTLDLDRSSLVIRIAEDTDGSGSLASRELSPAPDGDYAAALDVFTRLLPDFMWGWGNYTIGERPEYPAHPELQVVVDYLATVVCQTRGGC